MDIVFPIAAVTLIGLLCAVMLVVASKFMSVPEDETFRKLRDQLPGANCGACGFTGCDGYAKALAAGEAKPNLCVPGGEAAAKALAAVLGVDAGDVTAQVAYVACCGDPSCTSLKHEYQGIQSCTAAKLYYAGDGACSFGCLGYGDCSKVCPNHGISIEDGLAFVQPSRCVGCGLCAKACPNHLIHLTPVTTAVVVRCSSTDKGALTNKACKAGCIGCKKCQRECPRQAITVENNLAVIDYEKCNGCGRCAEVCTTNAIHPAAARELLKQCGMS